jgi:hypothetical protein
MGLWPFGKKAEPAAPAAPAAGADGKPKKKMCCACPDTKVCVRGSSRPHTMLVASAVGPAGLCDPLVCVWSQLVAARAPSRFTSQHDRSLPPLVVPHPTWLPPLPVRDTSHRDSGMSASLSGVSGLAMQ